MLICNQYVILQIIKMTDLGINGDPNIFFERNQYIYTARMHQLIKTHSKDF